MASDMTSQWIGINTALATSPDLYAIMEKVDEEGKLEAEGAPRYFFLVSSMLKAAEFAHFQWREGNLDLHLGNRTLRV